MGFQDYKFLNPGSWDCKFNPRIPGLQSLVEMVSLSTAIHLVSNPVVATQSEVKHLTFLLLVRHVTFMVSRLNFYILNF